jgi:hypothetical protein
MDPALNRLVTDPTCRITGPSGGWYYNPSYRQPGNPSQQGFCAPDNVSFAKLVAQYGAAIAPTAMHSARTTGYGGFEIGIEGDFTSIDSNASYWKNGTEGVQNPTNQRFSIQNVNPPGFMQLYTFKIRKGFPFGFELAGNFGYLAQSSIYTLGADVRWSLFEGFRTGIPAIFPELAVGGSVRTITGTDQLQLTVVGADAQISKPIPILGTVVLTPWVGYQYLRIFGDSGLIDFTPNTDAVNLCGYSGTNTPATPDPTKTYQDGQAICNKGTNADFNNTNVFNSVRLNRHRIVAGLQLRVQMVMVGFQFMYDVVDPGAANQLGSSALQSFYPEVDCTKNPSQCPNPYGGVARQMTLAFDLGAVF